MQMRAMVVGVVVVAVMAAIGLSWIVTGNAVALFRYFAPQVEQVRRETFEQSKAYRQGMVQELQNMRFQYEQAEPEHRAALRAVILRRAVDMPDDALTADLRAFVASLRRPQ